MALCSLCETTCAHLILCVPFTPRAVMGIKQTKLFVGLKQYITLKSDVTYTNNSDAFIETKETPPVPQRREHWFMSSRITGNDTVHSQDSDRFLHQSNAI